MKLKYFIPLFALVALLSSCSDDEATYLDAIRVSSSYVSIDMAGGEATITVNAQHEWAFENIFKKTITEGETETVTYEPLPDWLEVSQLTGPAGETKLTFSAEETLDGRNAELRINCGGQTQIINVIQGLPVVEEATCAQVIEGPEGKTFRVTGKVTNIENTTYGNWWLEDETGRIYIYGTLDAKGNTKNFLSLGLEAGDVVTVEGPKTVYGSKIELVDVTVLDIQKSLVKVESVEPETATLPKEGGDFTVNLTCKGQGVSVELPDDAKDWLSINAITGSQDVVVKMRARANDKGSRSTTIVFKTTDAKGKEYTAQTTLTQEGSIVDISIAEFLKAEVGPALYRITGVITKVADAEFGNVYVRDWSGTTYVYGIGAKGDFQAAKLKAGDVVTLIGPRSSYKDAPQMSSATLENVIHVTEISIADFLKLPDSSSDYYMVTGMIDEIKDPVWGNLYLSDGDNSLYVYGCYPGWGATGNNRQNLIETLGLGVGDGLSVIGIKATYYGEPELKNGIYFSHSK